MMQFELSQQQLTQIYNWIDEIPLSRIKKNISRDFSDGVLIAEILIYYNAKNVELHNYIPTGSLKQKIINWKLLNNKILQKFKIKLTEQNIKELANAQPKMVQKVLKLLKNTLLNQMTNNSTVSKTTSLMKITNNKQSKNLTYKQIIENKTINELIHSKNNNISLLKNQIQLLATKFNKLQQILKNKDLEIQTLVRKIQNKNI